MLTTTKIKWSAALLVIFIIWAFDLHRIAPLVNDNNHHLVVESHNISNSQTDSGYSNNIVNIKDSFDNDNATHILILNKPIDSFDQNKKLNNSEINQNNPIENNKTHNISNSQTDSDYSNNIVNIKDSFDNNNATHILMLERPIASFYQKKKLNKAKMKRNTPITKNKNERTSPPLKIKQNTPITKNKNERTLPPLDRDCFKPNTNVVVNRNYNASLSSTTKTTKKSDYLPYPAVVVGFPKAGTSSIHALFNSSGLRSLHWACPRMHCGKCIKEAVDSHKSSPLRYCSKKDIHEKKTSVYDVWAQIDYDGDIYNDDEYNSECYWPQVQALEEISRGSPNATFILNIRNFYRWWSSVQRWFDLASRISRCSFFEGEATEEDFKDFFCGHVERIRAFVRDHPSHALVEVDVEDPMTGRHLERLFRGVNASFWGKRNENKKKRTDE